LLIWRAVDVVTAMRLGSPVTGSWPDFQRIAARGSGELMELEEIDEGRAKIETATKIVGRQNDDSDDSGCRVILRVVR
jgi:hypothetical protein